jgi:hypothetical protein
MLQKLATGETKFNAGALLLDIGATTLSGRSLYAT